MKRKSVALLLFVLFVCLLPVNTHAESDDNAVVDLSAWHDERGVILKSYCTVQAKHMVFAVYDEGGRMLAVTEGNSREDTYSTLVVCDTQSAYRAKLFLLDEAWCPIGYAVGAEVQEKPDVTIKRAIRLSINGQNVNVDWEENGSVNALIELLEAGALTINTSRYGGFEQVGSLGTSIPHDDTRITTEPGDIVLYSGNQIVVFFGTNTWAYTRLGRIKDMTAQQLKTLLDINSANLTFSLE